MVLCLFDEKGAETQIPMRDYDADVLRVFVPGSGRVSLGPGPTPQGGEEPGRE
jgi:hypothetical protein